MTFKHYYFNNSVDNNGRHEVHTEDCRYLPAVHNRTYIWLCSDCKDAIDSAKREYPYKSFDGCFHCCNPCHLG